MLSIVARTRRKSRFAEKIIRLSLYNRTITLTNMEKYRNMKVAELKAILKQNNLSSKGNKKQLLTTIETYICETPGTYLVLCLCTMFVQPICQCFVR
uniref:SAP domain-containing protein n=1 Tax=Ciona intestinalis TaxID=7719 RepID=H2XVZ0_CIOIN